jgi:hypothetical protein
VDIDPAPQQAALTTVQQLSALSVLDRVLRESASAATAEGFLVLLTLSLDLTAALVLAEDRCLKRNQRQEGDSSSTVEGDRPVFLGTSRLFLRLIPAVFNAVFVDQYADEAEAVGAVERPSAEGDHLAATLLGFLQSLFQSDFICGLDLLRSLRLNPRWAIGKPWATLFEEGELEADKSDEQADKSHEQAVNGPTGQDNEQGSTSLLGFILDLMGACGSSGVLQLRSAELLAMLARQGADLCSSQLSVCSQSLGDGHPDEATALSLCEALNASQSSSSVNTRSRSNSKSSSRAAAPLIASAAMRRAFAEGVHAITAGGSEEARDRLVDGEVHKWLFLLLREEAEAALLDHDDALALQRLQQARPLAREFGVRLPVALEAHCRQPGALTELWLHNEIMPQSPSEMALGAARDWHKEQGLASAAAVLCCRTVGILARDPLRARQLINDGLCDAVLDLMAAHPLVARIQINGNYCYCCRYYLCCGLTRFRIDFYYPSWSSRLNVPCLYNCLSAFILYRRVSGGGRDASQRPRTRHPPPRQNR